jgi:tetratricopeptide (TPR) repeat protein
MIRTATHRRRRPGWLVVTVITLLSAAASARQDPFEPTVTTEEAELLALVTEVAATNVHAAVALLTGEDLSDAGPALDFALGNLYFRSDDLLAAKRSYELAIGKMPKFRGALANLGRVYLLQEQTADAIRIYQGLVKDGQADADILVLLGHALLLSERELSAENAYRQAILLDPDNRDALLGIAKCLLLQQRYRESVSLLDEVLALDQFGVVVDPGECIPGARRYRQRHRQPGVRFAPGTGILGHVRVSRRPLPQ